MSWITDDWHIKLLALGLSVLMLGAVAFSQNPPTTRSLTVSMSYSVPPNLIIINPPTKTTVTFSGLADVIGSVTPNNLVAIADATHASPGQAVRLNVTARSTITGVIVQNPAPIAVNIDVLATVDVPVQIIANGQTGWTVTKKVATCAGSTDPCKVHFTGPKTWTVNLRGQVVISPPINVTSQNILNQPIVLLTTSGALDTSRITSPPWGLDFPYVDVHIEAQTGVTSTTVPLVDAAPSHGPPPGYRVVGITLSPISVVITGDQAVLGGIQRIQLSGSTVDLSSSTSTVTFRVPIPYPNGVTSVAGVTTASITYQIAPNPNVSPSP